MIVVILLLLQFSLLFLRPSFTITLEEKKSFKIACRQGNIGVLSSLFCVLDPSFDENYAIRFGCKKGCLDAVKFLLSLPRVNPMAKENAPLILAAKHGHDLIVNLLLQEDRINPAEPDNEALITACLGGHTKVVRVLLSDNRINAAARFNMPLIIACQHGFTDIVSLLLQTARVDSTFPNGEPLKIAIQNGHNNIVEILQGNRLDFYDAISFLPQINFNTGESSAECSINEEHDEPFNFGSPAFKPWIENHLPRHNLIKRSLILNGVPLNLIGNEPLMVIYEEFRFLIMDAPTIYTIRFYIRRLEKYSVSDLVRLCSPTYPASMVESCGIRVHELVFHDCFEPPTHVINQWLNLVFSKGRLSSQPKKRTPDYRSFPKKSISIAIQCISGLGKSPVLVAIALIELGLTPCDAIQCIKSSRPYVFNQREIDYLLQYSKKSHRTGICSIL